MAKKDNTLEILGIGALIAGGIYYYKTQQAKAAAANTGSLTVTLPTANVLQPNTGVPQAQR